MLEFRIGKMKLSEVLDFVPQSLEVLNGYLGPE